MMCVEVVVDKVLLVVVFGGLGFVGVCVVEVFVCVGVCVMIIFCLGCDVMGVCEVWVVDLVEVSVAREALAEALRDVDCVVLCVGVIGGDDEVMWRGNGDYNVFVIEVVKKVGVGWFVYVSVASVVSDVVGKTSLMRGYFEGKCDVEVCLCENYVEGDYFIVKLSFIYGGDVFLLMLL